MAERMIDVLVIGAGPAGLSAAIAAATYGASVLLVDENSLPGGQLFKQIHKFFGSKEHKAGTRGFRIGEELLKEARQHGVEIALETLAWGVFDGNLVGLRSQGRSFAVQARQLVIATGAVENALAFTGSTLPGVMTAGAAQTLCNIQRVLPGRRILMVGTGNVGLIVSYQLMQAGAQVVGIIDSSNEVGGYEVHANKLRRAGVPFHLSYIVQAAYGKDCVERVSIAPLDTEKKPVGGSALDLEVDTVCLAVGLSPRIDLLLNLQVPIHYCSCFGGWVPKHTPELRVRPGLFIAGDVSGIEEASTALEEGRLAGTAAAAALGFCAAETMEKEYAAIHSRLNALRSGRLGEKRRWAKEQIHASCVGGSDS